MKAYRFDDFRSLDDLCIHEEKEPLPQRGELMVNVKAVSLNFRDIAMLRGHYPQSYRKGLIPLSDGAGEVVAVGEEVATFKKGDRVMGTFSSPLAWWQDARRSC